MSEWIPSTEDIKAAWAGLTGNPDTFDAWLYAERERVWNMMAKIERDQERDRIIALLENHVHMLPDCEMCEWVALIKGENK